jgi:hypothetical protein
MPPHNLASDIRGTGRLLVDAATSVTDLVEAMHGTIAGLAGLVPGSSTERTRGITRFVYRCVGGGMRLAGGGLDLALAPVAALTGMRERPPAHENTLAVLNGVLGDHLAATRNPLAITMSLRRDGARLELHADAIRKAIPAAKGRVLIQAHGLCMHPLQWARGGQDQVAALGHDLGFTNLHLHYNTGLHIAANGRALAGLLETLVAEWPVPSTNSSSSGIAWADWWRAAHIITARPRGMPGRDGCASSYSSARRTTGRRWSAPAMASTRCWA